MPENISKHLTYKEVTYSQTAIKNNIDNTPNEKQLSNIKLAADKIFEPLREWVGGPIYISSCFRSDKLNKKIGGANSSQHLANNGAAFDIDDTYGYKTNKEMFHYILDNLEFDQLIWEFGNDNNPDWVHFSYNEGKNRKETLRSKMVDGKTVYVKF
ncbi:MAG: peptidase M15 [Ignavibacteria bacterium]|nr:peptidase M15 [Ignavibacteria bacterium]